MNDHDLLVRIDERIKNIDNFIITQSIDIDKLKTFKNRSMGAIGIIGSFCTYLFFI